MFFDRNDDRDLTVSDYALEDCTISGDQRSAACVSRISWIRLPSVTENSEVVTCNFAWNGRNWKLTSMEAGPFQPELGPTAQPNAPAPEPEKEKKKETPSAAK